MLRGLYTSALGMRTMMDKMDVVTNNIANVDTAGYKKDISVTRSFSEELMDRLNDPGDLFAQKAIGNVSLGVFVDEVHTDFSNGSLMVTDGALDLAIVGDGFFAVNVENADGEQVEKYTRDGAFTLALDGTLMTKDGYTVAGVNGNIVLPSGEVSVDASGFVYVNGALMDQIKTVQFGDLTSLRKYGDNLYSTTEQSAQTPFNGMVQQGVLERSNVNSVQEMIDMITLSRTYEANQRLITVHDNTLSKAVNDVARK